MFYFFLRKKKKKPTKPPEEHFVKYSVNVMKKPQWYLRPIPMAPGWTSELSAFFLLCNRCWVAGMPVPVCLQKLLFWNWFQLTASEATGSRCSYALKVCKNKYFIPKIPNPLLKSYISKPTKSCLSVKVHSKYGQLTDRHKIYILDKMMMLNPLKYDVIVLRWINKQKTFIWGSNVALTLDQKFPVNSLTHFFCQLWQFWNELFMLTIHLSMLELCGQSSKQYFYFLSPWMTLWTRWWPEQWTGILLVFRKHWWIKGWKWEIIFKKLKFSLLNTSRTFYLFTCNLEAFSPIIYVKIKIFVCDWKETRGVCGISVSWLRNWRRDKFSFTQNCQRGIILWQQEKRVIIIVTFTELFRVHLNFAVLERMSSHLS